MTTLDTSAPAAVWLPDYLACAARHRFAWGEYDCGLLVAGWVAARTGCPDPAAPWRGRYASEAEAAALLGWGGIQAAVARQARGLGLARTRKPRPGDIGVVTGLDRRAAVAAIRVTGGWMLRSSAGLQRVPHDRLEVLAAWSVPEARRG